MTLTCPGVNDPESDDPRIIVCPCFPFTNDSSWSWGLLCLIVGVSTLSVCGIHDPKRRLTVHDLRFAKYEEPIPFHKPLAIESKKKETFLKVNSLTHTHTHTHTLESTCMPTTCTACMCILGCTCVGVTYTHSVCVPSRGQPQVYFSIVTTLFP